MSKRLLREKVAALAALELTGSSNEAGRMVGIPGRTIRQWRAEGVDNEAVQEAIDEAVEIARQEVAAEAAALVADAATVVARRVRMILETEQWQQLKLSELRDLSVLAGVWFDKLELLQPQGKGDRGGRRDFGRTELPRTPYADSLAEEVPE